MTLPASRSAAACGTTRPGGPLTIGVEEEFLLLDPETGAVAPCAPDVIRACGDRTAVVPESMRYVVETRTPVCHSLGEAQRALAEARRVVAEAAARYGAASVASGAAPFGVPWEPLVTDTPRYRELAHRFPFPMRTTGTCACHVHVGVPDRDHAVAALLGVRPWLPALLALTANSPIRGGHDSGWASHRFGLQSRWPTAVPPPPVQTLAEYDALVRRAVTSGTALDPRSIYFLARVSPRYPTVEVRIADVCPTADEAAGYAGLVRALVATALDDAAADRPAALVPHELLQQSCDDAARVGLAGLLLDPGTGREVEAWTFVERLLDHVGPRLRADGDEQQVAAYLDGVRLSGGGAERQRQLFREAASPGAFVAALARAG